MASSYSFRFCGFDYIDSDFIIRLNNDNLYNIPDARSQVGKMLKHSYRWESKRLWASWEHLLRSPSSSTFFRSSCTAHCSSGKVYENVILFSKCIRHELRDWGSFGGSGKLKDFGHHLAIVKARFQNTTRWKDVHFFQNFTLEEWNLQIRNQHEK